MLVAVFFSSLTSSSSSSSSIFAAQSNLAFLGMWIELNRVYQAELLPFDADAGSSSNMVSSQPGRSFFVQSWEIKKHHSSRRIVFFDGRNLGPQNIKYGTCQFGSFLRRATSPLSLPALPYPAPIFSARASSATVADALISLSNVTSRPRHAFDTWYFLRGVVWSHDKAGPVQFVHNGEIQHMAHFRIKIKDD